MRNWMRNWITAAAIGLLLGATAVGSVSANAGTAPAGRGELYSVSCPTDTFCMAVGFRQASSTAPRLGLAYRWDGTAWQVMPTKAPPVGAAAIYLVSVSCTSATACTALGWARSGRTWFVIAERWNGASWRFLTIQRPGHVSRATVSCSGSACIAVGSHTVFLSGGRSRERPVTWQLVGGTFRLRPAVQRPFYNVRLTDVSCVSSDNCTAVGDETFRRHPMVEHWNGTRWSWGGNLPNPNSSGVELWGISCPAPRSCVAVGQSGTLPAVENRKAGAPWYLATPRTGPNIDVGYEVPAGLGGVSCVQFQRCAAVGSWTDRGDNHGGLLAWRDFVNGHFVLSDVPVGFDGVSCRDTGCVYVGSDAVDPSVTSRHPVIYRGRAHPTQQVIPPVPG